MQINVQCTYVCIYIYLTMYPTSNEFMVKDMPQSRKGAGFGVARSPLAYTDAVLRCRTKLTVPVGRFQFALNLKKHHFLEVNVPVMMEPFWALTY